MRLGSYYRKKCFEYLFGNLKGKKILDLGGYDGYFMSGLDIPNKIVLDMRLKKSYPDVIYRKGSYLTLSKIREKYDVIFLFDVLQYIDTPFVLFQIIAKHMNKDSALYVSVPDPRMSVFPNFISKWLHRRWGDFIHIGYSKDEIKEFLPKNLKIERCCLVQEKYFRFLYFPLRFVWGINNRLGQIIVNAVFKMETRDFFGENGHIYVRVTKV